MTLDCSDMIPAGNYMFKVNNRNTRIRCEIFSKLKNKDTRTTSLTSCSSVSIVNFEQVNAGWDGFPNLRIDQCPKE